MIVPAVIIPAALVLGYLLGSVPFGLLLTQWAGGGDIRAIGSGNIGATNVLRTGRKGLAAATLVLDAAKGFAAVALVEAWAGHTPSAPMLAAAVGAMLGHCFPVWLGFRGGKGVATMLGVCLALSGVVGLVYALVWLGAMAATRTSSLGGLGAAISAPLSAMLAGHPDLAMVLALLSALVVFQHRANIARLMAGTEPRFGGKKMATADGGDG